MARAESELGVVSIRVVDGDEHVTLYAMKPTQG